MDDKLSRTETRLLDAREEIARKVFGEQPKMFSHAVLCALGLPYRNPGEEHRYFQRTDGRANLILEAGMVPHKGGWRPVGLPYGPKSRLLLLHLCSQSVKKQSPLVEVEDSFTAFARSIGIGTCGKSLNALREQMMRMSVVSMRLSRSYGDTLDVFQGHLFSKFQAHTPNSADQLQLWTSYVEFSPDFFLSLVNNAVPLSKDAIGALKHSSRALDIYTWLAHRLYRIPHRKAVNLPWTMLRQQFGEPEQEIKSFKRAFSKALKQVLVVYPSANVQSVHGGLELRQSPPPIPKKVIANNWIWKNV